jgi:hypothetical protein
MRRASTGRLFVLGSDRDDVRRVDRDTPARIPLEPRERARAAAACILDLLRDVIQPARDLDRLTGHQKEPGRGHLETAPTGVAAQGARHLIRLGFPLEPRLLLVPADRIPVDRVLERLELGLEPVYAPMEVGDRRVIA